jgi:hypothetical protein
MAGAVSLTIGDPRRIVNCAIAAALDDHDYTAALTAASAALDDQTCPRPVCWRPYFDNSFVKFARAVEKDPRRVAVSCRGATISRTLWKLSLAPVAAKNKIESADYAV